MYTDYSYYTQEYGGSALNSASAVRYFRKASDIVDILAYRRIAALGGLDHLTDFQQKTIKDVCCELADFEYENEDILENPISGYSINGVSVQYANADLKKVSGITIPSSLYQKLQLTGLCWGGAV